MRSENITYIGYSQLKKSWYIVSGEPLWWGLSILPINRVRKMLRKRPVAYLATSVDIVKDRVYTNITYALGRR